MKVAANAPVVESFPAYSSLRGDALGFVETPDGFRVLEIGADYILGRTRDEFAPWKASGPTVLGTKRTGWDGPAGGSRRSSTVSGVRASRRDRLRLDAVRIPSRQFAGRSRTGWDSNPRGQIAHTISSRAP